MAILLGWLSLSLSRPCSRSLASATLLFSSLRSKFVCCRRAQRIQKSEKGDKTPNKGMERVLSFLPCSFILINPLFFPVATPSNECSLSVLCVCVRTDFFPSHSAPFVHTFFIYYFLFATHTTFAAPSSVLREFVCLESKRCSSAFPFFHSFIRILIHQRGFLFNNGTRTREPNPTQQI